MRDRGALIPKTKGELLGEKGGITVLFTKTTTFKYFYGDFTVLAVVKVGPSIEKPVFPSMDGPELVRTFREAVI